MQLRWVMVLAIMICGFAGLALAGSDPPQVVIAQLQVAGAGTGHAGDEFVQLYNETATPLPLDHWLLQYRSATAAGDCTVGWTTKTTINHGVIAAHADYLMAATSYLDPVDARFAAGLSDSKGAVRIVNSAGDSVDAIGWGGAPCGEGVAAVQPPGGQSLIRRTDSATGGRTYAWSGSNSTDLRLETKPLPIGTTANSAIDYPVIALSEVMPLATDDTPAFVELYNPGTDPVQLSAYGIATGSGLYHLSPTIIAPGGYLTLNLVDIGLSPNAAGDQLSLLDPTGIVIDRTDPWVTPTVGESWALLSTGWDWTNQPTPGTANLERAAMTDPAPAEGPIQQPDAAIEVSELLPQPSLIGAAQATKFVELHDTGSSPVTLTGYSLRSGPSWGNHAALPITTVPPNGYVSFPYTEVALSLAVSGGRVGLFTPTGSLVGDAVIYPKALSGQAYAKFADGWHFTTFATPGAANILVLPVAASTTKATTKPVTTKKPAVKKAVAAKSAKTKKATSKAQSNFASIPAAAAAERSLSLPWLLFILASFTMTYVIYEFRHDLNHLYFFCNRNLSAWRTRRRDAARRGDPGARE